MKKIFFLPFVALFMTNCSSDIEEFSDLSVIDSSSIVTEKDLLFTSFMQSVDSLNAEYPSIITRGSFINGAGVALADNVGYASGGCIGRWAGGVIGSLTGNPVFTVLGTVAGGRVGPYVCSSIASGIVSIVLSSQGTTQMNGVIALKGNFNIQQYGEAKDDSIGYFHNCIMVKITENAIKYKNDGYVNVELLYDDIVNYCADYGYYSEELISNVYIKQAILDLVDDITSISELYETGLISDGVLIDKQCSLLKNKCLLNNEEVGVFKEFSGKVVMKCAQLDEQSLVKYSKGLNQVITTSQLPLDTKKIVASSAQIAINSTLCWQQ